MEAVAETRENDRSLANIISIGNIVHISMDKQIDFNEQVSHEHGTKLQQTLVDAWFDQYKDMAIVAGDIGQWFYKP